MPTASVTTPIVLHPIQGAPLPKNYLISFQSPSPKVRREMVFLRYGPGPFQFWSLADEEKIHTSGFSTFLYNILHYTKQNSLWGQTIPVHANFSQPDTHAIFNATESGAQDLKLPEMPFSLFSPDWFPQLLTKNVPSTSPPVGRRIFWPSVSGSFPNAWMVMPNNRLEEQYPNAPFDKYSFWLSVFGVAIKSSANVNSPDTLSMLLGGENTASRLPKQCSAAQIVSKAGVDGNGLSRHMIWNGSRMLFFNFFNFNGFGEYAGSGLRVTSFQEWYTQAGPNSIWNLRKIPHQLRTIGAPSLI